MEPVLRDQEDSEGAKAVDVVEYVPHVDAVEGFGVAEEGLGRRRAEGGE